MHVSDRHREYRRCPATAMTFTTWKPGQRARPTARDATGSLVGVAGRVQCILQETAAGQTWKGRIGARLITNADNTGGSRSARQRRIQQPSWWSPVALSLVGAVVGDSSDHVGSFVGFARTLSEQDAQHSWPVVPVRPVVVGSAPPGPVVSPDPGCPQLLPLRFDAPGRGPHTRARTTAPRGTRPSTSTWSSGASWRT